MNVFDISRFRVRIINIIIYSFEINIRMCYTESHLSLNRTTVISIYSCVFVDKNIISTSLLYRLYYSIKSLTIYITIYIILCFNDFFFSAKKEPFFFHAILRQGNLTRDNGDVVYLSSVLNTFVLFLEL